MNVPIVKGKYHDNTTIKKGKYMNSLFFKHDRLMELTPMKIVRQWAQTINWNARLLSIRGPEGVG